MTLRRAPLNRGTKPLAPMSKKRRKALRQYQQARKDALSRAEGRCEARIEGVCTVRATTTHHVILRSQGGPDEAWNLLAVCGHDGNRPGCHAHIHANPAWSMERGFIRSASAA